MNTYQIVLILLVTAAAEEVKNVQMNESKSYIDQQALIKLKEGENKQQNLRFEEQFPELKQTFSKEIEELIGNYKNSESLANHANYRGIFDYTYFPDFNLNPLNVEKLVPSSDDVIKIDPIPPRIIHIHHNPEEARNYQQYIPPKAAFEPQVYENVRPKSPQQEFSNMRPYALVNYKNPVSGQAYSSAVIPKPKEMQNSNQDQIQKDKQIRNEMMNQQLSKQKEKTAPEKSEMKSNPMNFEPPLYPVFEDYNYPVYSDSYTSNPERNFPIQQPFPLIFKNPRGTIGLPFYPASNNNNPPRKQQSYNYEGIPITQPKRNQAQMNRMNPKVERRIHYPNAPFNYPQDTIWQGGDNSAEPENEILVRQLNETCAYVTFKETTPGNEDGSKHNIFNAGDYSAQQENQELIRSVNITCENYNAETMRQFTSDYAVEDNCWQCVKKEEYEDDQYNYNPEYYDRNYDTGIAENLELYKIQQPTNEDSYYRTINQRPYV